MQELPQSTVSTSTGNETNIKDLLLGYLVYWKWFVLSLMISLLLGFFYLRYTTTQYGIDASIIIKDEKKGGIFFLERTMLIMKWPSSNRELWR